MTDLRKYWIEVRRIQSTLSTAGVWLVAAEVPVNTTTASLVFADTESAARALHAGTMRRAEPPEVEHHLQRRRIIEGGYIASTQVFRGGMHLEESKK